MAIIRRRPTALPNYMRIRAINGFLISVSFFLCIALFANPRLSLPEDYANGTSHLVALRPSMELVAIMFALSANSYELYQYRYLTYLDPRPRNILGILITVDVIATLGLIFSAMAMVPHGRARAHMVTALVCFMCIEAAIQVVSLSYVVREEKMRRANLKTEMLEEQVQERARRRMEDLEAQDKGVNGGGGGGGGKGKEPAITTTVVGASST